MSVADIADAALPDASPEDAGIPAPPSVTLERPRNPHTRPPSTLPAPPPPPISGGTLIVTRDGRWAVASDPDRDQIHVVDLRVNQVARQIDLRPGDEPGRLVEDAAGHVHVVLRRGGALIDFDPGDRAAPVARRDVCPTPRGVAADGLDLHVACADGELVTLPGDGGPPRVLRLDRDLRDVLVEGDGLWVSRFRSAEVLRVRDGAVMERRAPPPFTLPGTAVRFEAAVAWRMVARPGGGALLVHQRGRATPFEIEAGAYGEGVCGSGIVEAVVTPIAAGADPPAAPTVFGTVLPVDAAVSPDGHELAILGAGNTGHFFRDPVGYVPLDALGTPDCLVPGARADDPVRADLRPEIPDDAQPVALAYAPDGRLLVQSREPPVLLVPKAAPVVLSKASRDDVGLTLFHRATSSDVACASCHAEAGDDGRVWYFTGEGARRTPSLRGGLLATAPFHWAGDLADFPALVTETYVKRMGGGYLPEGGADALGRWLDAQAEPPLPPSDPAVVSRGRLVFQRLGCNDCHEGRHLTDDQDHDVGTGGAFQTPSLRGLFYRAPYLHDGCARTLAERFGRCANPRHGETAGLSAAELSDLTGYLETL